MDWSQRLTAIKDLATLLAICAGGVAGYYKFLRGRVFRPRLEIRLILTIVAIGPQTYARVLATLTNKGSSKIDVDRDASALRLFKGAPRARPIVDEVTWERLATLRFTERHEWIESGETIQEFWFVDLADASDASLFMVELRVAHVTTRLLSITWSTTAIAEKGSVVVSSPWASPSQ